MNKKRLKFFWMILNFLIILILVWSLINYKVLNNEISEFAQIGGLIVMILFVILLEGAPVFAGSSFAVAVLIATGKYNPFLLLSLFLVSAIVGDILYYYLGYFSGKKVLKYFDEKDVKKYKKLFKKYGEYAMFIMAVFPLPYLPTLAGIFKMSKFQMFFKTLIIRLIRHTIVFYVWYLVLV